MAWASRPKTGAGCPRRAPRRTLRAAHDHATPWLFLMNHEGHRDHERSCKSSKSTFCDSFGALRAIRDRKSVVNPSPTTMCAFARSTFSTALLALWGARSALLPALSPPSGHGLLFGTHGWLHGPDVQPGGPHGRPLGAHGWLEGAHGWLRGWRGRLPGAHGRDVQAGESPALTPHAAHGQKCVQSFNPSKQLLLWLPMLRS